MVGGAVEAKRGAWEQSRRFWRWVWGLGENRRLKLPPRGRALIGVWLIGALTSLPGAARSAFGPSAFS
jgi:hypothetical protein